MSEEWNALKSEIIEHGVRRDTIRVELPSHQQSIEMQSVATGIFPVSRPYEPPVRPHEAKIRFIDGKVDNHKLSFLRSK
jgi:hypothetical protein